MYDNMVLCKRMWISAASHIKFLNNLLLNRLPYKKLIACEKYCVCNKLLQVVWSIGEILIVIVHGIFQVCIKVTIINFTVTKSGLEDQLLRFVQKNLLTMHVRHTFFFLNFL